MTGVGPAAQMAAYSSAGVNIRRLAKAFGLPAESVTRLVLGIRLHEALRVDPDLRLVAEPGSCMIVGCGRRHERWQLCSTHAARLFEGRPLLGPRPRVIPISLGQCKTCGATWCNLQPNKRQTCGARACRADRTAQPRQARNRERDAEILDRVRAGDQYRDIAADYGITDRRITQLANRAGLFRYRQRKDSRLGR